MRVSTFPPKCLIHCVKLVFCSSTVQCSANLAPAAAGDGDSDGGGILAGDCVITAAAAQILSTMHTHNASTVQVQYRYSKVQYRNPRHNADS